MVRGMLMSGWGAKAMGSGEERGRRMDGSSPRRDHNPSIRIQSAKIKSTIKARQTTGINTFSNIRTAHCII